MFALKKRLLFKIWKFPFLSETFVLEQILTAIQCGYQVKILVEELQDLKENRLEEFFRNNDILDKVIIEDYKIPQNRSFRIIKAFYLLVLYIFEVKTLLKCFREEKWKFRQIFAFHFFHQFRNYDIIHVEYGTNVRPLDLYKKVGFIQAKLIVSFHGHDAFFPINGIIPNYGYYDDLFKYGDLIVANTEYLANQIESIGCDKNKIRIIPVGVNTELFKASNDKQIEDKVFKIISVGRLDRVKGQRYAIEAIRILKNKGYKVHLSIIGEGSERKNLESLIQKNDLVNEVVLTGKKNRKEVEASLNEHDIFVLPAIAVDNERRETQGLATLEAQSCGLPVVVFNSGGVKYTVLDGETGFVVPEYDIETFVLKIEKLITDIELRKNMGQKAIQFVKNEFSHLELRKIWCKVYSEILNDEE